MPIIKVDWRATPGNQVTFPLGPSVAKAVRFGGELPVKFEIRGMYVPVYPDSNRERFIIQLIVTPVVPALLPGPLFGG